MRRRIASAILAAVVVVGCEDEEIVYSTNSAAPEDSATAPPTDRRKRAEAEEEEEAPPVVEFQEDDFTETERSRDPFRSFIKLFDDTEKNRIKTQREVVLDEYGIGELKLIGIVSRIQPPKAMLVDPTGKGHVITRGQFVGRAEIVQGGTSGADYEINWRVERIRDQDIVLVREDPANPDVPSATRILALRTDEIEEG